MILVAKVEDSFVLPSFLRSYGCVALFKFLSQAAPVRVKDRIQLRSPDGQVRDTYIAGFEHVKGNLLYARDVESVGIVLPPEISKADVPPGTEVWIAESDVRT